MHLHPPEGCRKLVAVLLGRGGRVSCLTWSKHITPAPLWLLEWEDGESKRKTGGGENIPALQYPRAMGLSDGV